MDALAQKMGYARASSIQRYEDARLYAGGYLKRDLVSKMAEALVGRGSPIIRPDDVWVLAGPEFAGNRADERSLVSSFDPDEDGNGYSRDNWRPSMPGAIPEIDAKLGAGEGIVGELVNLRVGDDNYSGHRVVAEWILSETFLRHEAKASRQDTVIMEIIGNSMSPTYGPGDRVLVDQAQTRLVADTVYAISDGYGEPQIKRLQRIPFSDPVMVKIISDNQSLSSFDVELERLTIIGRVCGHIARK